MMRKYCRGASTRDQYFIIFSNQWTDLTQSGLKIKKEDHSRKMPLIYDIFTSLTYMREV